MTTRARFESVEEAMDVLKAVPEPDPQARSAARTSMLADVDMWRERRGLNISGAPNSTTSPLDRVRRQLEGLFSTSPTLRQSKATALTAALAIVLATAALTGGVAYADTARPGDTLYGVDRFIEHTQLGFAFTEDSRANLQIAFAEERLEEIDEGSETDTDNAAILTSLDEAAAALQALLDSGELSVEAQARVQTWLDTLLARRETIAGLETQGMTSTDDIRSSDDEPIVTTLIDDNADISLANTDDTADTTEPERGSADVGSTDDIQNNDEAGNADEGNYLGDSGSTEDELDEENSDDVADGTSVDGAPDDGESDDGATTDGAPVDDDSADDAATDKVSEDDSPDGEHTDRADESDDDNEDTDRGAADENVDSELDEDQHDADDGSSTDNAGDTVDTGETHADND